MVLAQNNIEKPCVLKNYRIHANNPPVVFIDVSTSHVYRGGFRGGTDPQIPALKPQNPQIPT